MCHSRWLLRLARTNIGVRCLGCGASAIALSLASVLRSVRPGFRDERVYELSSRGPFFDFLRRNVADLTFSEYLDDVHLGELRNGVLCQDVQHLTFPDATFDLCTSTEVFEHVADDRAGFAEVRRVLRPGGMFVLTVPIADTDATITRAETRDGHVVHLLPPTYHDDRIRGRRQVLVFRDYGRDIIQRLLDAGFAVAYLDTRYESAFLGQGRAVVVGRV